MSRVATVIAMDVRRQAASGFWLIAVLVGVIVAALVRSHPSGPGRWWPILLLAELVVTCFYFAAAQVLAERDEGVLAALAVTPLGRGEYLAALTASLGALGLVESVVLLHLGGARPQRWGFAILAVALACALHVLYGVIAVAGYPSMSAFLLPSGVWTLILAVPFLPLLGARGGPWLWLHPLHGCVVMLQVALGSAPPERATPALVLGPCWVMACFLLARRRLRAVVVGGGGR